MSTPLAANAWAPAGAGTLARPGFDATGTTKLRLTHFWYNTSHEALETWVRELLEPAGIVLRHLTMIGSHNASTPDRAALGTARRYGTAYLWVPTAQVDTAIDTLNHQPIHTHQRGLNVVCLPMLTSMSLGLAEIVRGYEKDASEIDPEFGFVARDLERLRQEVQIDLNKAIDPSGGTAVPPELTVAAISHSSIGGKYVWLAVFATPTRASAACAMAPTILQPLNARSTRVWVDLNVRNGTEAALEYLQTQLGGVYDAIGNQQRHRNHGKLALSVPGLAKIRTARQTFSESYPGVLVTYDLLSTPLRLDHCVVILPKLRRPEDETPDQRRATLNYLLPEALNHGWLRSVLSDNVRYFVKSGNGQPDQYSITAVVAEVRMGLDVVAILGEYHSTHKRDVLWRLERYRASVPKQRIIRPPPSDGDSWPPGNPSGRGDAPPPGLARSHDQLPRIDLDRPRLPTNNNDNNHHHHHHTRTPRRTRAPDFPTGPNGKIACGRHSLVAVPWRPTRGRPSVTEADFDNLENQLRSLDDPYKVWQVLRYRSVDQQGQGLPRAMQIEFAYKHRDDDPIYIDLPGWDSDAETYAVGDVVWSLRPWRSTAREDKLKIEEQRAKERRARKIAADRARRTAEKAERVKVAEKNAREKEKRITKYYKEKPMRAPSWSIPELILEVAGPIPGTVIDLDGDDAALDPAPPGTSMACIGFGEPWKTDAFLKIVAQTKVDKEYPSRASILNHHLVQAQMGIAELENVVSVWRIGKHGDKMLWATWKGDYSLEEMREAVRGVISNGWYDHTKPIPEWTIKAGQPTRFPGLDKDAIDVGVELVALGTEVGISSQTDVDAALAYALDPCQHPIRPVRAKVDVGKDNLYHLTLTYCTRAAADFALVSLNKWHTPKSPFQINGKPLAFCPRVTVLERTSLAKAASCFGIDTSVPAQQERKGQNRALAGAALPEEKDDVGEDMF